MRRDAGFSILEAVIAMAVIVIVSVAMYSTLSFATTRNSNAKVQSFFALQSENYLLAYYKGAEGYSSAMNLLTGEDLIYGNDVTISYTSDFVITQENGAYFVDLDFDDEYFEIVCRNDRQIICSNRVNV